MSPEAISQVSTVGATTVTVVKPISIALDQALNFGAFVAGATQSEYFISAVEGPSPSVMGDANKIGEANRASFTITGEANSIFHVTGETDLTLTGAAGTMSADLTDQYSVNGSGTALGVIGSNGSALLEVGGNLILAANQPPGEYSVQFSVTAQYN